MINNVTSNLMLEIKGNSSQSKTLSQKYQSSHPYKLSIAVIKVIKLHSLPNEQLCAKTGFKTST